MDNKVCSLVLCFCTATLVGCSSYQQTSYSTYQPYTYIDTSFPPYYSDSVDSYKQSQAEKQVGVPDSYYVGAYHSPTPHKDLDRNWVNSQNPQGYTIEVVEGDRAAQVASKLYKLPKTDRMAQIKYNKEGKAYYMGLYGSYGTYEEAQKALENLPADLKQGAGIKSWSTVQLND